MLHLFLCCQASEALARSIAAGGLAAIHGD